MEIRVQDKGSGARAKHPPRVLFAPAKIFPVSCRT